MPENTTSIAEKNARTELKSLEKKPLKRIYDEAGNELKKRVDEIGLFSNGLTVR